MNEWNGTEAEVRFHPFTRPIGLNPLGTLSILYQDVTHLLDEPRRCSNRECLHAACHDALGPLAPFSPKDLDRLLMDWEAAKCDAYELLGTAGMNLERSDSFIAEANTAFMLAWNANSKIAECWTKQFPLKEVAELTFRTRLIDEKQMGKVEKDAIRQVLRTWPVSDGDTIEYGLECSEFIIEVRKVMRNSEMQRMHKIAAICAGFQKTAGNVTGLTHGSLTDRLYELLRATNPFWHSTSFNEQEKAQAKEQGTVAQAPSDQVVWDLDSRTLFFKGAIAKQFGGRSAENQFSILEEFQRRNWPTSITFEKLPGQSPIKDQLRNLNSGIALGTIQFKGDGTGKGIAWAPVVALEAKDSASTPIYTNTHRHLR